MKLITKQLENIFAKYPLYSQDGKGESARVLCKFFTPDAQATWLILEAEKTQNDYTFYGYVTLDGYFWEYGYFTLDQLKQVRGRFGLPIERDIYSKPGLLSDYIQ